MVGGKAAEVDKDVHCPSKHRSLSRWGVWNTGGFKSESTLPLSP